MARLIIVLLRDPKDPKDQRIGKEPTNQVIFGPLGPFEHRYTKRLRELNRTPNANYDTFRKAIENPDPAVCANVIIGLIKVTTYLLDNQIRRLEEDFVKKGGLRERMTRARLNERDTKRKKDDS